MSTFLERIDRQKMKIASLVDRRSKKIPFVILVDVSGSMSANDNISKVNRGLRAFYDVLLEDSKVCESLDLSIIAFGGEERVQLAVDFNDIRKQELPVFEAYGNTPLCTAIVTALDNIEDQIDAYQAVGIVNTKPIMLIMTDGEPSRYEYVELYENGEEYLEADPLRKTDKEFLEAKAKFDRFHKMTGMDVHIVALGDQVKDLYFLQQFATGPNSIKRLEDTDILAFFKHLTVTVGSLPAAYDANPNHKNPFEVLDVFEGFKKPGKKQL
ncbi:vWA domain-containing protein [Ectobacillus ponti]|uniref:VWFA domain-containing protein n=1 Tax=Ectobacillus ponti TaxID=2961894 RepID=A0AA42BQU4_9BACI|nr:hypothetical protein [Ectobacillus ponti]MCP8970630.1 hypothetical protein [Ectobacillus ponti]